MNKNAITKTQLADELGFSLRTLQRKLYQAGVKLPRGLISIDTQVMIKAKLGYTLTNFSHDTRKGPEL